MRASGEPVVSRSTRGVLVWSSVLLVAVGLLVMHGLEPGRMEQPSPATASAALLGSSQPSVMIDPVPMGHLACGSRSDHLLWSCVWIAVGALLLAGALGPAGRAGALGAALRAAVRLGVARASRAPPSSVRLSLVGVLVR